jgi:hypothetical protein
MPKKKAEIPEIPEFPAMLYKDIEGDGDVSHPSN